MPQPPGPCRWNLPDPAAASPRQDLVAAGADLEPATVISAYAQGLFPMHLPSGELGWWSPDPRGVLPLADLRVSRSLARSARRFEVSVDRAFPDVIRGCADPRRESGWITDEILTAYGRLHDMGWAHSVEVWRGDRLVGGLYGVEIGGLFAGESMFHRETDASKVALLALVHRLRGSADDGRLLDVQWRTDHLASLGVVEIPRAEYLRRLRRALQLPALLSSG